jgi:hypothetical protein
MLVDKMAKITILAQLFNFAGVFKRNKRNEKITAFFMSDSAGVIGKVDPNQPQYWLFPSLKRRITK